jgi:hypothetical protein
MGLGSIVRSAVAIAHNLTKGVDGLQVDVTVEAYSGIDGFAKPTYESAQTISAVMEKQSRLVRTAGGQEVMSKHRLTFVRPVEIGPKDRITLPDGSTGPILDVDGVVDSDTDFPYATGVLLG